MGNDMNIYELADTIENTKKVYSLMISSELLNMRKNSGLTQKELAEKSGIPQKTISRIETGKDIPNIKTIIRLVDSLNKKFEFKII